MSFRTNIELCLDDKIDKVFNCDFVDEPDVAPSINDKIWNNNIRSSQEN